MTAQEIVQALRCCADHSCSAKCPAFPAGLDCREEMHGEALALLERLTAENAALREKVPQWISVEDRLPEVWINEEDDVLVNYMIYSPDFGVEIGSYHAKAQRWVCMGGLPCPVTHWMPLPDAPEEGGKHE